LRKQVQEKEKHCENLELEIAGLRKELKKTKTQLNLNLRFSKGFKTLDEIIKVQRSPLIKAGLGYNADQNGETLESMKSFEACTKIYANVAKGSNSLGNKTWQNTEGSSHNQARSKANIFKKVLHSHVCLLQWSNLYLS